MANKEDRALKEESLEHELDLLRVGEDRVQRVKSPPPSPILSPQQLQTWLATRADSPPAEPPAGSLTGMVDEIATTPTIDPNTHLKYQRRHSLTSAKPNVPTIHVDFVE